MNVKFNAISDLSNNVISDLKKREYIKSLESAINYILKISNLEINEECEVVVTEDFKSEVEEFQKQYNKVVGFTNDKQTYAIVDDYMLDNKKCMKVFLNKLLIFGINNLGSIGNTTMHNFCLNSIHHELMHAYDEFQSNSSYATYEICKQDKELDRQIMSISIMIWKEYFADRMASKTFKGSPFEEFYNQIFDSEKEIQIIIEVNRKFNNFDKMYNDVRKKIVIYLRFTAYHFGKLHSLGEYEEVLRIVEIENNELKDTFIYNIYKDIFVELNSLYEKYLKWDLNEFENLSKLIIRIFENFGIFLSNTEDGQIYISLS